MVTKTSTAKKNIYDRLGLDKKDRRILYELDLNSRQSNSSIGKKVSLDKNVVNYRINKMIEKKIIKGFYTEIDMFKLGYKGYRLYLKFKLVSVEKEKEISKFLVDLPSTWWVGTSEGEWDMAVLLWEQDFYKFYDFYLNFLKKYKKNIEKIFFSEYAELYGSSYAYVSPDQVEPKVHKMEGRKSVKVTDTDIKVLKTLSKNARMPTVEIAKKLGVSSSVVKYSIKKLQEDEIIKAFRVLINTKKLGYTYYKVDVNLDSYAEYEEIIKYAEFNPNVIFINRTIGVGDFEMEIHAENHEKFVKIMNDFRARFSESFSNYNFVSYSELLKLVYFGG